MWPVVAPLRRPLSLVLVGLAAAGCNAPFARMPAQPPPGAGSLAGFVRTEDGRPVAGASVAASCFLVVGNADAVPQITTGEDGWYDLGVVGLTPGPCFIKGGTPDGLVFFVDNVTIVPGQSLRLDLTASRIVP